MTDTTECQLSGMPRDWCAHCLGHTWGGEPVSLTQPRTPRPPRKPRPAPAPDPTPERTTPRHLARAAYPVLCALGPECRPYDPDHPRHTDSRSNVCAPCEDRTREALASTRAVWIDLEKALTNLPAVDSAQEFTSGGRATGLRLNEAALEARTFISQTVFLWGQFVRQERGHRSTDSTPPGVLAWLARGHVTWILRHPDTDTAVSFARDAAECWRLGRKAAFPAGWRRVPIPDAACTVMVRPNKEAGEDFPEHRCGQALHAMIRPDMSSLPDLECEVGHHTPPDVWRRHNWRARLDKPTTAP